MTSFILYHNDTLLNNLSGLRAGTMFRITRFATCGVNVIWLPQNKYKCYTF